MDKRFGIEGSAASMMVQLMRKHGYNKDVDIEIGTVVTPLPSLSVKLDTDGITLDKSELIVAEHLTEHKRTASINGAADVEITFRATLKIGDKVIVFSADKGQSYYVIDKAVL